LAQMAQLPELVKGMEELQSEEKRIALVYCRCGSRLSRGKRAMHATLSASLLFILTMKADWYGDILPWCDSCAKSEEIHRRKRHTTNVTGSSPVRLIIWMKVTSKRCQEIILALTLCSTWKEASSSGPVYIGGFQKPSSWLW
jgi:hypothetical protein